MSVGQRPEVAKIDDWIAAAGDEVHRAADLAEPTLRFRREDNALEGLGVRGPGVLNGIGGDLSREAGVGERGDLGGEASVVADPPASGSAVRPGRTNSRPMGLVAATWARAVCGSG